MVRLYLRTQASLCGEEAYAAVEQLLDDSSFCVRMLGAYNQLGL